MAYLIQENTFQSQIALFSFPLQLWLFDPLATGLKIVKIFNLQKLHSGSGFLPSSIEEACDVLEHYDNARPWAEITQGDGSWEQG